MRWARAGLADLDGVVDLLNQPISIGIGGCVEDGENGGFAIAVGYISRDGLNKIAVFVRGVLDDDTDAIDHPTLSFENLFGG